MWNYKILNLNLYYIFWYFIIYSIAGLIIETLFTLVTAKKLESRKGFIYGPFTPIYGVAAIVLILFLEPVIDNIFYVFLGGFILGSLVEYSGSFFLEVLFNAKWWDYKNSFLNIKGRICLIFSIYWGLLSILLMYYIYQPVNKLIELIPPNVGQTVAYFLIPFLIFDIIITTKALKLYAYRLFKLKPSNNVIKISSAKNTTYNKIKKYFHTNIYTDEVIHKTFPNAIFSSPNE